MCPVRSVANLNDHSYTGIVDVNRWFGNHFSSYVHLEVPHGSKTSDYGCCAVLHRDIGGSPFPAMIAYPINPLPIRRRPKAESRTLPSLSVQALWVVPAVALVIVVLFLAIGRIQLSQTGSHLLSALSSTPRSLRIPSMFILQLVSGSATLSDIPAGSCFVIYHWFFLHGNCRLICRSISPSGRRHHLR